MAVSGCWCNRLFTSTVLMMIIQTQYGVANTHVFTKPKLPGPFGLTFLILAAFPMLAQQALAQKGLRGELEDILKSVSTDVQKHFYDPQMKGLDWCALTEDTRQ